MTDKKKPEQSMAGNDLRYVVEVRFNSYKPTAFGGDVFDNRWQRLNFKKGQGGVPTKARYEAWGDIFGLMTYEAANALRFWFLAEIQSTEECSHWCWETRLVPVMVTYSVSTESQEPIEHRDMRGLVKTEEKP
ncbi:MAG: hypothetical protein WC091_02585 [Sulfuricellaceae bacterium]